jgi:hypothetical protein
MVNYCKDLAVLSLSTEVFCEGGAQPPKAVSLRSNYAS